MTISSTASGGADKANGYLMYPGATTPSDLTDYRNLSLDTNSGMEGTDGGSSGSSYTIKVKLSSGEGLDFGAAGGVEVDVTDFIDTASGLTESANDIQVNLLANAGLGFDPSTGGIKVTTGNGVTVDGSGNVVNDPTDENVALATGFYGG